MNTPADYSMPVHKALQEPDVVFGIGLTALLSVISITVILASLISIWCVLLGLIAIIILRMICKEDPYLVDILLDNLMQPDWYRG
jgi:type IV secretory pathway VirB3-like protein